MTDGMMGSRLRTLRELAGLSIDELADLADVARGTVWKIESRPDANPFTSTVERLARVLGCRVGWLAAGEGREPPIVAVVAAVTTAREQHGQQRNTETHAGVLPPSEG